MNYEEFLKQKQFDFRPVGLDVSASELNASMFDFQKDIVRFALRKGRAAIFAGTGLGKTIMQCEWARHIPGNVLIFAPLCVAQQTVAEAAKFGIDVNYCKEQSEVRDGISVTNYERMDKFDISKFTGVVLDESSILKNMTGKMRTALIESCSVVPYRLACTATPAPNDYMELCNHAEFLGVLKSQEVLAVFFTHDGGDTSKWRLKRHAVKDFWRFVASWSVMLTNPADLGYDGSKFVLPPLTINQHVVETENSSGDLFQLEARTLQERTQARRDSINERAAECKRLVEDNPEGQWLIWCNLNSEAEAIKRLLPDSVEVRGSDSPEKKENSAMGFANGDIRILISKPSIFGMGLNFQKCHQMAFVGLSDSFEDYYQSVRRCWRFGQKSPTRVDVITADKEGAVVENIRRKERDFGEMLKGMISSTQEITKQNIKMTGRQADEYKPQVNVTIPAWI